VLDFLFTYTLTVDICGTKGIIENGLRIRSKNVTFVSTLQFPSFGVGVFLNTGTKPQTKRNCFFLEYSTFAFVLSNVPQGVLLIVHDEISIEMNTNIICFFIWNYNY